MLYFDSLSKKSTPNLSRKNTPSPTLSAKTPTSDRPDSRSSDRICGENGQNNTRTMGVNVEENFQRVNHLHPNSTLHHKYLLDENGKSPHGNGTSSRSPGGTLADMDPKTLEEYLTTFQPALLGSLSKLNSLGLRDDVDEDPKRKLLRRATETVIMTRIRLKWNTSRGMPPIFGFFGKVTARGKKALLNAVILLILNVIFLTGCAFAFVAIENNEKYRSKAIGMYQSIQLDLKYFLNKTHNPLDEDGIVHHPDHTPWGDEEWELLKKAHSSRCFKLDNHHTQKNLWNFWSALDFSATVLTTIGYGSMSPRTTAGKWVCIFYSLAGIPIMAMYLALFSKGIVATISACITLFSTVMSNINRNFKLSDMTTRVFSLLVLLFALFVFVCMWSGILNHTNPRDSFIKCMYFYVITLTTVGLGDISMTEAQPFVLIRVLFVFCVGLTLVTSVFNALRSVSTAHTRMLKAKGRKLTSRAQEVVMDKANKFIRSNNNNGDGQTEPLTKEELNSEFEERPMVETTFMEEEERIGFNHNGHNHGNNDYPYE